ncbi:MAG: O-antigen ligase family protein [Solirubrobacterales bacterium]|nr:O-antigen ligase family protein [Solirubrobacterales bacterium]
MAAVSRGASYHQGRSLIARGLHDPGTWRSRRAIATAAGAVLTVLAGLWLAFKAPGYGVPLPLVGVVAVVPGWLAVTRRTGVALAVVLLYLGLLDGALKLQSGSTVISLGRDVVLYAAAIGALLHSRAPRRRPAMTGWIVAWGLVVVVQLANPADRSLAHSIAALRQHLEFVPLFFLGYAVLRDRRSLHALFALLLAVAAINGAVAAYQSTLSPAQLAGWGPGYQQLAEGMDARTFTAANGKTELRPPGLGSDMGFGGILGAVALPGGVVLLLTYWRRRWLMALIVLGLIGASAGVLTSESRSSVITAVVTLVAMLALTGAGGQAKRAVVGLALIIAFVGVTVVVVGSFQSTAFDRYSSIAPGRAASTTVQSRASTWGETFTYINDIPLGAGLGTVGPAASKVGGQNSAVYNAESQFTFLVVELGIPGLVLFLAFQAALCRTLLRGLRREPDRRVVLLMAGVAAPLFGFAVNWLVGVNTTSPPNAPYLWLAAGIIAWWLVDRPRRAAAGAGAAPTAIRSTRRSRLELAHA